MNSARISVVILSILLAACGQQDSAPKQDRAPHNAALGYRIDLKETTNFTAFQGLNQVTLTPEGDHLLIAASGTDPSIVLPALALTPPVQFAVRVEMTTPADTLVEIFYTTNTAGGFVPDHVVSLPVKAGRNVMLFEINDPEFSGGVRLDPGQVAGKYLLHALEIYSSGPMSLAKPSPAPAATASSSPQP